MRDIGQAVRYSQCARGEEKQASQEKTAQY
jgi:hypothetical protein